MSWNKALSDKNAGEEVERRISEEPFTPIVTTVTEVTLETDAIGEEDDPDRIRVQIEQTRAGMSETINAIQERLNPETLKEQAKEQVEVFADEAKEKLHAAVQETIQTAKDAVYDATIGKAANVMHNVTDTVGGAAQQVGKTISQSSSSVFETLRQNPLPAALIGAGIGMLLMRRNRKQTYPYERNASFDRYNVDEGYTNSRSYTGGRTQQAQSQASSGASHTQSTIGEAFDSARETASSVASQTRNQVSNIAGQVSEQVSSLGSQAREQVGNLGSQVHDVTRRAQTQYEHSLQENPLAVGAVALALGAAVGLALPSTRVENRLMGEAHENLVQVAEEAARDTIVKVKEVAGEAGRAARREAEFQGLSV